MAEVYVNEGESVDSALRRFKRKVQQQDIIKEVKRHSYYMKPGEKKRLKQALARKRSRKKVRRERPNSSPSSYRNRKGEALQTLRPFSFLAHTEAIGSHVRTPHILG